MFSQYPDYLPWLPAKFITHVVALSGKGFLLCASQSMSPNTVGFKSTVAIDLCMCLSNKTKTWVNERESG